MDISFLRWEHSLDNKITLEDIYRNNYKLLFRIVHLITQNVDDTCDILQDTFLQAHTKFDPCRTENEIKNWLITIAKNTAFTIIKKQKRYVPIENYLNRVGSTELSLSIAFLYNFEKLEKLFPEELFSYLMMHIMDEVSLLSISKKTGITYEKLRYWKKILIKELKLQIKGKKNE